MKNLTRAEAAGFLLTHDCFTILTHRRPDGDTLGSSAFLCRLLRQLGKSAWILENPQITPKYAPLHQGLTKAVAGDQDTLVCVDVASPNMLPEEFAHLLPRIALRIDHHGTATPFTPESLVDPQSASCGELLYDVSCLLGSSMDPEMADALYTAVSTDTGCFRYANTTAHSLETAAACLQAGARSFQLNQLYFETNSLARLRIQGWMVENARFLQGGKVAICALPKAVEEQLGATEDDMENISGFPRTIEGVVLAGTLREEGPNKVKLSLRAAPGCDASAICAKFGGGGHKGAAGASFSATLEEAVEALEKAIPPL